jgi:hypothetical protein
VRDPEHGNKTWVPAQIHEIRSSSSSSSSSSRFTIFVSTSLFRHNSDTGIQLLIMSLLNSLEKGIFSRVEVTVDGS